MKNMFLTFIAGLLLWIPCAKADNATALPEVKVDEILLNVNGLVCETCGFGLAKKLRALDFVDKSKLKDGALVDTKKQTIRLALLPRKSISLEGINKAMSSGGYELSSINALLEGKLKKEDGDWYLEDKNHPADYALDNKDKSSWVSGVKVQVLVSISKETLSLIKDEGVIFATVLSLRKI